MARSLTVRLPAGEEVPRLGLGTWRMGEDSTARQAEVAALKLGLDLGASLIDTAEMYGEGGAEEVVAEAIAGRRREVFLVSKVYPHNASLHGVIRACERSLKRLGTDHIDLYLLHWRGPHPLARTVEGFERLWADGKIRYWGVSNFDVGDMEKLVAVDAGKHVATNQVLYNLARRGVEWSLLPWQRKRGITTMAYSPIDQTKILDSEVLRRIARKHGATPARIALAWLLQLSDVMTIPKAADAAHVRDNIAALDLKLDESDLAELDKAFPPPKRETSLEMN